MDASTIANTLSGADLGAFSVDLAAARTYPLPKTQEKGRFAISSRRLRTEKLSAFPHQGQAHGPRWECLRKVECQNNNVWISFKEGGCGFNNVNECSRGGSRRRL